MTKTKIKHDIDLSKLSEEEILKLRLCDLLLKIEGTWLSECIEELYKELADKGLKFKPTCYLADEWLTPERETVIGIPFYLADPTLMKLENKMMLEVEGGTKEWCMKLLRHEAGHAFSHAFRFNRRKKWQKIFGHSSIEYPETYKFRPYSKNFVRHLDDYYAQYHPDEDFVETFAVWLTPGSDWENKYKGWRAIRKLRYVGELMNDIRDKEPPVKSAKRLWRAASLKITLKNHYKKKQHFFEEDFPEFHDPSLKRVFQERSEDNKKLALASPVITKHKKDIIKAVHFWTREKKYIISDLLKKINQRCRVLKLVSGDPESLIVIRISTYITTLIMNYFYTGRFRGDRKRKK